MHENPYQAPTEIVAPLSESAKTVCHFALAGGAAWLALVVAVGVTIALGVYDPIVHDNMDPSEARLYCLSLLAQAAISGGLIAWSVTRLRRSRRRP